MREPSGLEFCVRNRRGRFVRPGRPVEALLNAISVLEQEVYQDGRVGVASDSVEVRAAQAAVLALLGLEPLPDPEATRRRSTARLEE